MAKPKINKDLCILCGICVSSNPGVFYFADDGSIGINDGDASATVAECPVSAIEA